MSSFLELLKYILIQKKYYLIPIIIFIFILGFLMVVSKGSTFAPFIYAIF
jgi:hypothetical protein